MKKTKSITWIQDWGTYPMSTLVSVNNKTSKELIESITEKDWIEALKCRYEYDEKIDQHHHFTKWKAEDDKYYSVLFLKEWKWEDYYYIMLAHELIHAVSFTMGDMMDLIKENEAMAYQHSYLMEMILKRLNKYKKDILY